MEISAKGQFFLKNCPYINLKNNAKNVKKILPDLCLKIYKEKKSKY